VITRMAPQSEGGLAIWVTIKNVAGKQLEIHLIDLATR